MTEFVTVGKIVNTQGLKGEVRVLSQSDFPEERFKKGSQLMLFQEKLAPVKLVVASHRLHKNFHLLSFVDHPSINDVEKYKGALLKVATEDLPEEELLEDEFYYHEIIGLEVISETGENLGKVKEIFSTGANDVWVVTRPQHKDWYLPYIEDVVKEIDLDKGEVHIQLMEGLLDED